MDWIKVNLICFSEYVNIIEEIFIAHKALSISLVDESFEDPINELRIGENSLWESVEISALFANKISTEIIEYILEGIPYSNLKVSILEDRNWIEKYKKIYKPTKFGKRLWVVPLWCQDEHKLRGVKLILDPGMAFGSGSHETTRLCLEYLDSKPPTNNLLLDYGSGSGILSIASALLGANRVYAYDIDPRANITTFQNSKINGVDGKIEIVTRQSFSNIKVDILIANIFLNTLVKCKDEYTSLIKEKGRIVLSGILKIQLPTLIKSYQNLYNLIQVRSINEWCLVEFEKIN